MTPTGATYRDCEAHGGIIPLWSQKNYDDELQSADSRGFEISTPTGELAGFVFYREIDGEAWIVHLAVREKGRGEGTRLFEAFLRHVKSAGLTRVGLEVSVLNARARALYAKYGFTEIGLRKNYYQDGSDALVLCRGI